MKLIELTNSRRKLVFFLMGGEKSEYDIRRHLSTVTTTWVNKVLETLNHSGVILNRMSEDNEKMFSLNKENIVIRRTTDKFVFDFFYIIAILIVSFIMSIFVVSIQFLFGSLFTVILISVFMGYRLFRTPDMKKVFYKKTEKGSKSILPEAPETIQTPNHE